MINPAKIHKKTNGLAEICVLVDAIYSESQGGICQKDWMTLLTIRDRAAMIMGKIRGLDSELTELDNDSPCLNCKRIGHANGCGNKKA